MDEFIMLERRYVKSLATNKPYDAYNIFYYSGKDLPKLLGQVPASYAKTAEYFYQLEGLEVVWYHDPA